MVPLDHVRRRQGPGRSIRSNGVPTYFAADIGYVTEKFSRGFDHLIYIWGADHHGTVARLRNAAEAMGYDRDAVQVLLYAWVRFVSRRASRSRCPSGPASSSRSTSCSPRSASTPPAGSSRHAARRPRSTSTSSWRRSSRPRTRSIYVQYAHARIASILRKAAESGLTPASTVAGRLAGAPEAAPRPDRRPVPGGRRGRGLGRGDARRHRLRDGAGDAVPRVLPRRAGRRSGRAGAVRRAARARLRGEGDARQRAGPAGDLRSRADVAPAQPPSRRSAATGARPGSTRGRRSRPCRRRPGSPRRCRSFATTELAAAANSAASAGVSQAVLRAIARAPFGPSSSITRSPPQPAAAASAEGPPDPAATWSSQTFSWNSPSVSSSALRPALAELRRQVRRQRDVDRRFVGRVLLGMEDLLGRCRRLAEGAVDGVPAAARLERLDEAQAGRVREQQRLAEERRHRVEDCPRPRG